MHTTLAVKIIMILAITIINNNIRGVCRISQGGGPTLKFLGFCIYMPACREQRSCEPLLEGFGGMPRPKKILKNGAISCVLRAIFNHDR